MGIATGVVWSDVHAPEHDKKACSVVRKVMQDISPDIIIDLGDAGEFGSINPHERKYARKMESKRLAKDIRSMLKVSGWLASAAPKARKVKLIGNHELWVERYVDERPELEGLEELNIPLLYHQAEWEVVPHSEFFIVGKLAFHHGDRKGYQTRHHAQQWSTLGRSIVYGHRHDAQRFSHETLRLDGSTDAHAVFSLGCLRERDAEWMKNQRNNWNTGFGVFYLYGNGLFNFYPIDIIKGKAVWGGRLYEG